jgi:hypothetical protein
MNNLSYFVVLSRQKGQKILAFPGHSLHTAFVDGQMLIVKLKKSKDFSKNVEKARI